MDTRPLECRTQVRRCRPVRQPNDQDLPAIIAAVRQTVESLLAEHPEGHRAVITEPQIPFIVDGPPHVGFDVWELDGPEDEGGERVRLLARLVADDTIICVYGFGAFGVCRSQSAFGNPGSRADLIVSAVITEVDEGLAE